MTAPRARPATEGGRTLLTPVERRGGESLGLQMSPVVRRSNGLSDGVIGALARQWRANIEQRLLCTSFEDWEA